MKIKVSTHVDPTDDELPDSDRGRLCGAPVQGAGTESSGGGGTLSMVSEIELVNLTTFVDGIVK
jgi:hypothetical protein